MNMKQMSLGTSGFKRGIKRIRGQIFLQEVDQVVPWTEPVALIEPHAPKPGAKGGRPPFGVEATLRIHFLQQWFSLSDPTMEEALHEMALFRQFAGLDIREEYHLSDESTILRFRHPLKRHDLAAQILTAVYSVLIDRTRMLEAAAVIDATIAAASIPTKNRGARETFRCAK